MRPVETKQDLKRPDVFAEFVGHAARALDDLEVADEVVTKFAQEQFEELYFPTSGRVIFFQAITAQQSMLGRLLDGGNVQATRIDKKEVVEFVGFLFAWVIGFLVFMGISDRWDDNLVSAPATAS
jgi:hypothetical protein